MNLFKKYLVPHKDNDYYPHLFREASTGVLFVIIMLLFVVAVSSRIILFHSDFTALVLPRVLVDEANQDRSSQNFPQLIISPILQQAAQLKANDMASKGYFAHTSPDGINPWYWFKQVGYDFSYAGENLAINFTDSSDVNTAWMNSPGHRANILNGNFTEIGIATAQGMYQGRETTFVVQLFGRPAEETPAPSPSPSPTVAVKKSTSTVAKAPATSTTVLSESVNSTTAAPNGTNDLFIAVSKKSASSTAANVTYAGFLDRVLLSPGKILSFAYLAIALLLVIGLAFLFFAEIKRHHIRATLLTLGFLIILIGLMYIYKDLLFAPTIVV